MSQPSPMLSNQSQSLLAFYARLMQDKYFLSQLTMNNASFQEPFLQNLSSTMYPNPWSVTSNHGDAPAMNNGCQNNNSLAHQTINQSTININVMNQSNVDNVHNTTKRSLSSCVDHVLLDGSQSKRPKLDGNLNDKEDNFSSFLPLSPTVADDHLLPLDYRFGSDIFDESDSNNSIREELLSTSLDVNEEASWSMIHNNQANGDDEENENSSILSSPPHSPIFTNQQPSISTTNRSLRNRFTKKRSITQTPSSAPSALNDRTTIPSPSSSACSVIEESKDRAVKQAKRITVDMNKTNYGIEVLDHYYQKNHHSSDSFKIRLIQIRNNYTGKKDIYVHAADLGGVVERKSNISRMFGQFESPNEKILMNIVGAHTLSIGQESNILTYHGVKRFFSVNKMKGQTHFKKWIEATILPRLECTKYASAVTLLPSKVEMKVEENEERLSPISETSCTDDEYSEPSSEH